LIRLKVLFVCIENAGRSKMAEAFARAMGIEASSAGTVPSERVNPVVAEAMKEVGIDITGSRPSNLNEKMI
jgi:protein-tyrosine-phosphatase